jgi:hypothetical protein
MKPFPSYIVILLSLITLLFLFAAPEMQTARAANPASEARCAGTVITSPAAGARVNGAVNIAGSASLPDSFVRYQVDYSTQGLNLWVLVNSMPVAVNGGTLARWDTTMLSDGAFDLRVRAIDRTGNYCEEIVSPVYVRQSGRPVIGASAAAQQAMVISTLSGNVYLRYEQTRDIAWCTHSWELGALLTRSIKLCPGETYAPLTIIGDDMAVVGDDAGTAIIRAPGRSFGLRALGSNILIAGVRVMAETHPADPGQWLCLYEHCTQSSGLVSGGIFYGGGILLEGDGSTVVNSTAFISTATAVAATISTSSSATIAPRPRTIALKSVFRAGSN